MPKANGLAILAGIAPEKSGEMAKAGDAEGLGEEKSEPSPKGDAYEAELDAACTDLMQAIKGDDVEMVKMSLHRAIKACMKDESY